MFSFSQMNLDSKRRVLLWSYHTLAQVVQCEFRCSRPSGTVEHDSGTLPISSVDFANCKLKVNHDQMDRTH